jgi:hypothetical protein
MTKEQRRAFCDLMRKYTRLRINYFNLRGIMVTAQEAGKVPNDWPLQLQVLRESAESRAVIEETGVLVAHILQTTDEDVLMQLILEKVKEEDLPN